MSSEENQKLFKVIDSSLTLDSPKRTHQIIIDGEIVDVVFEYGTDKILPEAVAMKFAKDGFRIVHFECGTEVYIPHDNPIGAPVKLGDDEVIARYTELTFEAIRTRAVILPGGEKFVKEDAEIKDMIDFLMKKPLDVVDVVIDEEEELGELDNQEGDVLDENITDENTTDPKPDAEDTAEATESANATDTTDDADAEDTQGEVQGSQQPLVDNDHVEDGAELFTDNQIAANAN